MKKATRDESKGGNKDMALRKDGMYPLLMAKSNREHTFSPRKRG